jgi:hypothetical protein
VWNGTSIAGPHVAGLVALLVSARPDLAGNVDAIESIIVESAVAKTAAELCGGPEYPNNVYGFGRVDAYAAYRLALRYATDVADDPVAREPVTLMQNTPNPFNPSTVIRYRLSESLPVRVRVFDVAGREVRDLLSLPVQSPGEHSVVWDGRDDAGRRTASGVYFCRLDAGRHSQSHRMTLLK